MLRLKKEKKGIIKMRVVMVFDGLQIGGIERVGADYAKLFRQLGHDVTVVNLRPNLSDMEKLFPDDTRIVHFLYPRKTVAEQYAQLTKQGFKGTLCYLIALTAMPILSIFYKMAFKISMKMKGKYDLVIAFSGHFNDLNFVSANFIKSKRKMCWLHGALYSYALTSSGFLRLYNKIRNLIVLVDDAQEEALIYNKWLKLNINKLYNPTFIKNNPVDDNHVRELKSKYGRFLLMVSRFEYPHKDQYTVAKMIDIVREQYKEDYDLVFVGSGPEESLVKDFVKNFSIETQRHIHFEGNRFDVQDYYKAAFMLVHASVAGEGLPTIMIEAFAYNLPMVVTDSKTGPREILRDNEYGLLCQVQNPQDMAEKVVRLIRDEELYKSYKTKSKIRLKDFEPETIKMKLSDVLDEICKEER